MTSPTGRLSKSEPNWQDFPGPEFEKINSGIRALRDLVLNKPHQRKAMKLKCSHVSTCLPDYWGGHAKAHISVPVYPKMTAEELRSALKKEVDPTGIAGADTRFYDDEPEHDETCWDAAEKAVDELHIPDGPLFLGLPEQEEGDDSVYAYFIFEDEE